MFQPYWNPVEGKNPAAFFLLPIKFWPIITKDFFLWNRIYICFLSFCMSTIILVKIHDIYPNIDERTTINTNNIVTSIEEFNSQERVSRIHTFNWTPVLEILRIYWILSDISRKGQIGWQYILIWSLLISNEIFRL